MEPQNLLLAVATEADVEDVLRVERACFPPGMAYPRRDLLAMLRKRRGVTLLLRAAGEPVGYVSGYARTGGLGHVESLAIVAAARGQGHSKVLMELLHAWFAEQGVNRVHLEVSTARTEAIGLYERLGYRIDRRLARYYERPVEGTRDAWRMTLDMGGSV